jgi:hypothetical protein
MPQSSGPSHASVIPAQRMSDAMHMLIAAPPSSVTQHV